MKTLKIVGMVLLMSLTPTLWAVEVFFTDFEEAIDDFNGDGDGFVTTLDGWQSSAGAIEWWDDAPGRSAQEGQFYIELNASSLFQSATDIYRDINTIDGVNYRLSFIYAGRVTYDETVNRVQVSVGGNNLGTFIDDASSNTDHNWQSATVTFTGTGATERIEFQSTGLTIDAGRGMRLDAIRLEYTSHDIAVVKTDSKTGFQPGDSASYTITVTNNGPDDALDIDITDTLPNGVELSGLWSCSAPAGSSCSSNSGGSAGDTSIALTADIANGDAIVVTVPVTYSTDPSDY